MVSLPKRESYAIAGRCEVCDYDFIGQEMVPMDGGRHIPQPGNMVVCPECGTILVIQENRALEQITDEDMEDRIANDKDNDIFPVLMLSFLTSLKYTIQHGEMPTL